MASVDDCTNHGDIAHKVDITAGCTIDAKLDIKKAAGTLYAGGHVGYMKCSKAKAYSATKVKCEITGAPAAYQS